MGFLDSIIAAKDKLMGSSSETTQECKSEKENDQDETSVKIQEMIDSAYQKSKEDILGLGTCTEMAEKYLEEYGSATEAIDHLIRWQIGAVSTTGLLPSLGILFPVQSLAKVSAMAVMQMRMVGAIAELAGYHADTEERKTGVILCLLGSQAAEELSKYTSGKNDKFSVGTLKEMLEETRKAIKQKVGEELVSKFGTSFWFCGGGLIGAGVIAFSTYAVAEAAKAMFMNEIIDFEKQEQLEMSKMRLLINMAMVDGVYDVNEADMLKNIAGALNVSKESREILEYEIDKRKVQNVDLNPFKENKTNAESLLSGLSQLAMSDGVVHSAEKIYISKIASELGCQDCVEKLLK